MNIIFRILSRIRELKLSQMSLYCIKSELIRYKRQCDSDNQIANRDKKARLGFLNEITPLLNKIESSNGSRYYEKMKLKVAIISDRFLFECFEPVAELIYITPQNAENYIDEADFLLVASLWSGLNDEWVGASIKGEYANKRLFEVISKYKKSGKKVVFYNKEDPPHYDNFIDIARQCDVIFTTAQEKIAAYKKDCNNDNVYVLQFGFNPIINNPIGMNSDFCKTGYIFAGSWMATYPKRNKSLEMILDTLIQLDKELVIIDRNYSKKKIMYFFPEKYDKYTTSEVDHVLLQKIHKLYGWAININSVHDSKTMFSSRIYELLASGCLIISDESIGIREQFPEVYIVNSKKEVIKTIVDANENEQTKRQLQGIRHVMKSDTCFDRFEYMIEKIGIQRKFPRRNVLVVVDKLTDKIIAMYQEQSYRYKDIIEKRKLTKDIYEQYDCICEWSECIDYEKYYLEDMINAFKYTACEYITVIDDRTKNKYIEEIKSKYMTVFWRSCLSYSEFLSISDYSKLSNGYCI